MLEPDRLDIDGIAMALGDQEQYERIWFIDPDTGKVHLWTSDTGLDGDGQMDTDEIDLVAIKPLPSHEWYTDMADFAELISDEKASRRLARAIRGRGAFRRFNDELDEEYPELLEAWNGFRDARARARAVDWLLEAGLIETDSANRYLAAFPDPDLP